MTDNKPTHRKHSKWHDYSKKCIYHITLVVRDRRALLGNLIEVRDGDSSTICPWKDLHRKGEEWYGKAWMNLSPLCMDVAECIHNIPEYGKHKGPNLKICAQQVMDTIGNLMLLGLRRFQVHCRYKWERDHDTEARRTHQNDCVKKARLNYVLVSPFVMEHEAAVRDFCLGEGHSVIQLMDNGFTDYTTCPGNLFEYCKTGQVLLLVPSEYPHVDRKDRISRAECVALNERARRL